APSRSLIPLYLALSRTDDALATCRQALELDPDDFATWAIYARRLKIRGSLAEARDALVSALKSPRLADHPDNRAQIYFDLGILGERVRDKRAALDAFHEVVKILDHPQALAATGPVNRENLREEAANVYERMIRLCLEKQDYDRALALFAEAQSKYPAQTRR